MPVVPFNPGLADGLVALYNSEGAFSPFIAHLTPKLFERRIAAKALFQPDGVFIATAGSKVTGAIFTAFCPNSDKSALDFAKGSIDGFFFSEQKPAAGDELLKAALAHLRSRGARCVVGWATENEYPFWRDLYCGSEPLAHAAAHHVHSALLRAGFVKSQHSVALLAKIAASELPPVTNYAIRSRPAPRETFWDRNSWLDLWPMQLEAELDSVPAGRLGWCALPATSRRRGVRTAGIYSVFVNEPFRRRGVASALIARCFDDAKRDGAEEILIATGIDNHPAIRAYQKFGFSEVFQMLGTRLESL